MEHRNNIASVSPTAGQNNGNNSNANNLLRNAMFFFLLFHQLADDVVEYKMNQRDLSKCRPNCVAEKMLSFYNDCCRFWGQEDFVIFWEPILWGVGTFSFVGTGTKEGAGNRNKTATRIWRRVQSSLL